MKTLIYSVLFFLTLNSLYAQEVQYKENLDPKVTLTSLDFAKTGKIIPGVTLELTPKEATYSKFQVTLAHNLFKYVGSLNNKVNPMETALYAQMSFRF